MEKNSLSHQFQGKHLSGKLNECRKHWQTVSEHETVRNRSGLNKSNNLVSQMQPWVLGAPTHHLKFNVFQKLWSFCMEFQSPVLKRLMEIIMQDINLFDILILCLFLKCHWDCTAASWTNKNSIYCSYILGVSLTNCLKKITFFAVNGTYLIQGWLETIHLFWTIWKTYLHKKSSRY